MNRLLCSTGALIGRVNGRDHRLLPRHAPELRCDGYELMLYGAWLDDESLREALVREYRASGLVFPSAHVEKDLCDLYASEDARQARLGLDRFARNCDVAARVGVSLLVLHLWGGTRSDEEFARCLAALGDLREIARAQGLRLTVEGIPCRASGTIQRLREVLAVYPDCAFTLDTRCAAFAGQLTELSAPGWVAAHVRHVHISDIARGGGMMPILHPGEGAIDFGALFAALREARYAGDVVLESPGMLPEGVDVPKMNASLDALRALMDACARCETHRVAAHGI